jgi:IS5 family transposase
MKSLTDFAFNEEYERVKRLGDRLVEIESLIDWEAFRPIVGAMYDNKSERGGRPNIDEVVMVTLLVLAPAVAWAL